MSEVVELIDEYEDEGFSIDDDRGAEYALKRIRETQNEVEAFKDYYDKQIQRMQERADGITAFYMAHLEKYFGKVPHKSTKTQESYELPSAKLVRKNQAPEFIRKEQEVIDFLHLSGETQFIKVKESLDWSGLKGNVEVVGSECFLKETGEKVPGIEVVEREPKFDVTFKKEDK